MLTGRSCGGTRGHVDVVDQDPAAARTGESGQHAQQRGLAAARSTHQGEHLALVDLQADGVDGGEGAEALVDAFDDDLRLGVRVEPRAVGDRFAGRKSSPS